MRTIAVDDDVYRALEDRVEGFGDSPNTVLRRLLGIAPKTNAPKKQNGTIHPSGPVLDKRGKAPKTNLRDLVRIGKLKEGQALYMHDYQGNKLPGVQAKVRGNDLEFNGKSISMSALTKTLMQRQGYTSDSYRGPQFWYTAEGMSVKELWDEYLKAPR